MAPLAKGGPGSAAMRPFCGWRLSLSEVLGAVFSISAAGIRIPCKTSYTPELRPRSGWCTYEETTFSPAKQRPRVDPCLLLSSH